jgi:hypothetical protein
LAAARASFRLVVVVCVDIAADAADCSNLVARARIGLAATEPIEKAARLRPGPLPVGLILLVSVPEKLGLHCHAG